MEWNPTISVHQREAWVEHIFEQVKQFIASRGDKDITTCTTPCITTLKNSYVRGQIFPFVNIPIRYREKELLGLYEYFGDQLPLSGSMELTSRCNLRCRAAGSQPMNASRPAHFHAAEPKSKHATGRSRRCTSPRKTLPGFPYFLLIYSLVMSMREGSPERSP